MCNTSFEKSIRGIEIPEISEKDIVTKMNNGSYKSVFVNSASGGSLLVSDPRDRNFKLEFKLLKNADGTVKVQGRGRFARKANGGQYLIQEFALKEVQYESYARAISEMKHLLGNNVNFGSLEGSIFPVHGDNKGPKLK